MLVSTGTNVPPAMKVPGGASIGAMTLRCTVGTGGGGGGVACSAGGASLGAAC
nr:hypothetical protein [Rhodococcus sp. 06-1059B-a]